jgi:hypothetical protein
VRNHSRRSRAARLWATLAALVVVSGTFAVSTGAAVAGGSNALTVNAGEYTYKLKGSPKAGWTQITFENLGVEDHMMAVFKLKKGTTQAQLKKAIKSSDESALEKLFASGGDPTVSGTPGVVGPGQTTTTMTQMPAGTYGILCFIPDPDGAPHIAHGMYKVLTVSGKSNLKPPTDGVSEVTLSDTGITVPSGDAPKNITLKVSNDGTAPHGFQLVQLNEGKTIDDANAYFNTLFSTGTAEGEAPGVLVGGVEGIAPGGSAYLEWSLPAGTYGYLSTGGDDPPNDDFSKGLKGQFTIS